MRRCQCNRSAAESRSKVRGLRSRCVNDNLSSPQLPWLDLRTHQQRYEHSKKELGLRVSIGSGQAWGAECQARYIPTEVRERGRLRRVSTTRPARRGTSQHDPPIVKPDQLHYDFVMMWVPTVPSASLDAPVAIRELRFVTDADWEPFRPWRRSMIR